MTGFSGGVTEIEDNAGATVAYSGTATTTPANVPASADKVISGISYWNKSADEYQISFDGGTTYHDVDKKSFNSHDVKGLITQVSIKTAVGTADYKMIINFEDY